MPRMRSTEPFQFPPELTNWIVERLKKDRRRRGDLKKWLRFLRSEHPSWVPPENRHSKPQEQANYNDFRNVVARIETQEKHRLLAPIPSVPPPPAEAPTPPTPTAVGGEDLPAMAQAAQAMITLALARGDREALQFALEALAAHLLPAKK